MKIFFILIPFFCMSKIYAIYECDQSKIADEWNGREVCIPLTKPKVDEFAQSEIANALRGGGIYFPVFGDEFAGANFMWEVYCHFLDSHKAVEALMKLVAQAQDEHFKAFIMNLDIFDAFIAKPDFFNHGNYIRALAISVGARFKMDPNYEQNKNIVLELIKPIIDLPIDVISDLEEREDNSFINIMASIAERKDNLFRNIMDSIAEQRNDELPLKLTSVFEGLIQKINQAQVPVLDEEKKFLLKKKLILFAFTICMDENEN